MTSMSRHLLPLLQCAWQVPLASCHQSHNPIDLCLLCTCDILCLPCIALAPRYLASQLERVTDTASRRCLRLACHQHCMFHGRCTRPLATVHILLPPRKSGTSCRRRSCHCRHCTHSSVHWRQNCSADLMVMHITGHSNIDCYVTHAAALQFLLKLVLRWNSWMVMMMKVASVMHRVKKSIAEKVLTGK